MTYREMAKALMGIIKGGSGGNESSERTERGTVKSVSGKTAMVTLDGAESPTECSTVVAIKAGDRVNVMYRNRSWTVVGNITDPSASGAEADAHRQHFWADEQGAHVSETERGADGANMLLTSRKMEVRDGARGLISVSGFAGSTSVDYDEIASVEYFDGEAALATWRNISDDGELLGSVTDLRGKSVVRMTATSLKGGGGIDDWQSMFLGTVYGDGTPVAEMRVKSKDGGYQEAFMSVVGDEQLKKTQAFVKADEVFVKDVQVEPSGMSIAVGASPSSLTTTKSLVPLNVAGSSYGKGMYKSVGGCIGCNKSGIVRVSGQLYVSGGLTAGDRVYAHICRIDAKLNILSTNAYASTRAYGTYDIVVLPPVLVHVDAGDYLALYAQNYNGSRGNLSANSWSTYLTAEYVALD